MDILPRFGPVDPGRRRVLKALGGGLILLSVPEVLLGCSRRLRVESDLRNDIFRIGKTLFEFDGEWTTDKRAVWSLAEKERIFEVYARAYPAFADIYGTEPVNKDLETGTKVDLRKGLLSVEDNPDIQFEGLISLNDDLVNWTIYFSPILAEETAVHELAHLFFMPLKIPMDTFNEGFAYGSTIVAGDEIGEDYYSSLMRAFPYIFQFDAQIFNKDRMATNSKWMSNIPLYNLRTVLSANAWRDVYNNDSGFFARFRRQVQRLYVNNNQAFSPYRLSRDLFKGDFLELEEKHRVLRPPKNGRYIAFCPGESQGRTVLASSLYEIDGQEEIVLPDAPVEIWVYRGSKADKFDRITDRYGGAGGIGLNDVYLPEPVSFKAVAEVNGAKVEDNVTLDRTNYSPRKSI